MEMYAIYPFDSVFSPKKAIKHCKWPFLALISGNCVWITKVCWSSHFKLDIQKPLLQCFVRMTPTSLFVLLVYKGNIEHRVMAFMDKHTETQQWQGVPVNSVFFFKPDANNAAFSSSSYLLKDLIQLLKQLSINVMHLLGAALAQLLSLLPVFLLPGNF